MTSTEPPPRLERRRALTLLRRGYAVALAGVLAYVLVSSWDDLTALVHGARPWVLVLALLASFGQLAITSAFWSSALRAFGEPVRWQDSLDATLGSTPARYLPGSVWYAVGRAARLRRLDVSGASLGFVAALEMVLVPVVGFTIGGLLLVSARRAPQTTPALLAAAVALAVAGSPPVVNAVARRVAAFRGVEHQPLSWARHGRLLAWTAVFWLWSGSAFALYLAAFPAVPVDSWAGVAGAYMVAWGVGWLAIFAPQGVGVFEATLAAILGGAGTAGLALVVAGYRAVIAVRDGLGFVAVLLSRRRAKPPVEAPESERTPSGTG